MKRVINYPYPSNSGALKNAFCHIIKEVELVQGENALELTTGGDFYQDNTGKRFFVYAGEGVLEWQDCLKYLDFSNLPFSFLSYFLSKKEHSPNASNLIKRKIQEFVEVYDKNILKNSLYLAPLNFEKLDKALILGEIQRRENETRPY
ncbi:MAG: hypothetical protein K2O80_05590 [Helicobacter apodemus]|nr:hypothetical protein [Helicobacter apodemus]